MSRFQPRHGACRIGSSPDGLGSGGGAPNASGRIRGWRDRGRAAASGAGIGGLATECSDGVVRCATVELGGAVNDSRRLSDERRGSRISSSMTRRPAPNRCQTVLTVQSERSQRASVVLEHRTSSTSTPSRPDHPIRPTTTMQCSLVAGQTAKQPHLCTQPPSPMTMQAPQPLPAAEDTGTAASDPHSNAGELHLRLDHQLHRLENSSTFTIGASSKRQSRASPPPCGDAKPRVNIEQPWSRQCS